MRVDIRIEYDQAISAVDGDGNYCSAVNMGSYFEFRSKLEGDKTEMIGKTDTFQEAVSETLRLMGVTP